LYAAFLAIVSVLATIVSQGIAPALPGTDVGLELWIQRLDQLSGWLTQLTLLSGMGLVGALLSVLLTPSRLPLAYRGVALVTAFTIAAIVTSAVVQHPGMTVGWHLLLAGLTGVLATASVLCAVRTPHTRAGALALGLIALAGVTQVAGSFIALDASAEADARLFGVARSLATARLGAYALSLFAAVAWFVGKRPGRHVALLLIPLSLSAWVIHIAGTVGESSDGLFAVLAERSLSSLTTHPNPLVATAVHHYVEVLGLTFAWVLLVRPGGHRAVRGAMALCLASRGQLDVPLCALLVTCAAVLLGLSTTEEPDKVSAPT
jgi:hypothetical protein